MPVGGVSAKVTGSGCVPPSDQDPVAVSVIEEPTMMLMTEFEFRKIWVSWGGPPVPPLPAPAPPPPPLLRQPPCPKAASMTLARMMIGTQVDSGLRGPASLLIG